MQFFEDNSGVLRPIASIVSITRGQWRADSQHREAAAIRVRNSEGDIITVKVFDNVVGEITRASCPVLPAQPEYYLLTFIPDDQAENTKPDVTKEPILGWRVLSDGGVSPIVADIYVSEMTAHHGILAPNGTVQTFEASYDSSDEWIQQLTAMHRHASPG